MRRQAVCTRLGSNSTEHEIQRSCSRHCVASSLAFRPGSLNFVLRKRRCFCPFRPLIGAKLRAKGAQFACHKNATSLVLKHFIEFVSTVFVFCNSPFSPLRRACWAGGGVLAALVARLRQCVHNVTIIIGYHRWQGLSSEKCKAVRHTRRLRGARKP